MTLLTNLQTKRYATIEFVDGLSHFRSAVIYFYEDYCGYYLSKARSNLLESKFLKTHVS